MRIICPCCHTELSMPSEFSGGKLICPRCKKSFMCDENGVSYMPASTQSRGLVMQKTNNHHAALKRKKISAAYESTNESEEGSNGILCFWLGFMFWLLGLVIAAVVGKGNGVKKAIWGMFVSTAIYIVVWVYLGSDIIQFLRLVG